LAFYELLPHMLENAPLPGKWQDVLCLTHRYPLKVSVFVI